MSRRLAARIAVASACALLFGWFALRMVRPDKDALFAAFGSVQTTWLAAYLGILVLAQSVRTLRWAMLLRPFGVIPWRRLIPISFVGYMASFVLPGFGEFVRPLLVRDRQKLKGTAAFATIVIERIADGLLVALGAFFALLPLRGRRDAPWIDTVCFGTLALFVGALMAIVALRWKRDWTLRNVNRFIAPMSTRLAALVGDKLSSFVDGLRAVPNWRVATQVILWTVIYWGLNGLGLQALGRGFGIVLGWQAIGATIGLLVLGFFVPAPGQVGTFHFFFSLGLGLFLTPQVLAGAGAAYVVTSHALQVAVFVGLGLASLFSPEVRWWRGREANELADRAAPT